MSYATPTLVRQHGRLINIDIEQPCRGLAVELDYTGCGDRLGLCPATSQQQVTEVPLSMPDRVSARMTSVALDGLLMPDSGVALAWALNSEAAGHAYMET